MATTTDLKPYFEALVRKKSLQCASRDCSLTKLEIWPFELTDEEISSILAALKME